MFLNPLMLLALGGIAAPILVHLLNRRRIEKVTWAAMRFLQNAVKQNQRKMNIEDLLLLALRCLLVAFVALAMARPAIRSPITSIFGQSRVEAAIVLDNSASTAVSDGTTSRFEVSRKIGSEIISGLPRGSSAAVYLASDVATPLIAEPTADLLLARQSVEQAQRSDRSTNLLPAVAKAAEILAGRAAMRKELYLITDGQSLGLRQLTEVHALLQQKHDTIHTTFALDGIPESHNLAVSGFRVASGQFPAVDQPVAFDVQVNNYGSAAVNDVQVKLNLDREAPAAEVRIDTIPPGESRLISLTAKFHNEGYHTVTAQVPHDRMPADDQRTLALRVPRQLQILLVTSDPKSDSRESPTYFLRQALTPVDAAARQTAPILTRTVPPDQLEGTRLTDFAAVVLADVSSIPAPAVESLSQYVNDGGGLVIFPGRAANGATSSDKSLAALLPAKVGAIRGDPADLNRFLTFQSGDYTHPIVSLWSDPKAGTLASAHFFRSLTLTPMESTPGSPVSIVLRFSDGTPAMVSRRIGLGESILFASTANADWNDFPVRPAYLPLLYRTIGQLAQHRDEKLNVRVGDTFTFQFPATTDVIGKDAAIEQPDLGAGKRSKDIRRIELQNGIPTLTYDDTNQAGAYDVTIGGENPVRLKFGAQPDAAESNLALADDSQIQRLSEVAKVIRCQADMKIGEILERDRVGKELWLMAGIAALITAVVEMLLADSFSKSK